VGYRFRVFRSYDRARKDCHSRYVGRRESQDVSSGFPLVHFALQSLVLSLTPPQPHLAPYSALRAAVVAGCQDNCLEPMSA
jgi:hypothetical protein